MGMACADDARAKAKATAVSLIISFLPLAITAEAANLANSNENAGEFPAPVNI